MYDGKLNVISNFSNLNPEMCSSNEILICTLNGKKGAVNYRGEVDLEFKYDTLLIAGDKAFGTIGDDGYSYTRENLLWKETKKYEKLEYIMPGLYCTKIMESKFLVGLNFERQLYMDNFGTGNCDRERLLDNLYVFIIGEFEKYDVYYTAFSS